MLNKIYTDNEYMAQGFTQEEVPMIRKHDELFNKFIVEGLTKEEEIEMMNLIKILKI